MDPIGIIHSCFKEKFGIPRQPGIVPMAEAELELFPPYGCEAALRGLADFSHIWVLFLFHGNAGKGWHPTVRPPRLGGNRRIGVFASRSGFRPNPIGMSVVRLEGITLSPSVRLRLSGVDILDQSPVLDIKPYLPYADSLPEATGGFAPEPPTSSFAVTFSPEADRVCREREGACPMLRALITQILQQDPRPAYYGENPARESFGLRLHDLEVKWSCRDGEILVTDLVPV